MTHLGNQRQAKYRDKMRKAGYILVQHWIKSNMRNKLKSYVGRLNKK